MVQFLSQNNKTTKQHQLVQQPNSPVPPTLLPFSHKIPPLLPFQLSMLVLLSCCFFPFAAWCTVNATRRFS